MNTKIHNCAAAVFLLSVLIFPGVLSDLAATVPAGEFVQVPENTSLTNLDMVYSLFYYNDSGCWDPINKRIRWIGNGGTCCTDGQFYLLTYTEADDTWTIENAPWKGSGHGFDHNTMDPATGDHYYQYFGSKTIYKLKDGNYTSLPDIPYADVVTQGIAWFPELNNGQGGLVHVGGSNRLSWFDGTKWTKIDPPSTSWGGYATFAEYSPFHKMVHLGGGSTLITYTLDAQLNLTRMPDAPFPIRVNKTLCSADPVSGNFIVTEIESNTWYELDPVAQKWTALNLSNKPSKPIFQVPLPEYGVIFYLSRPRNATREVFLYRHSPGSDIEAAGPVSGSSARISVAPNPFSSEVNIMVRCKAYGVRCSNIQVFNISGEFIANLTPYASRLTPYTFTWNAASQPAGIYILKATAGKEKLTKRIYLVK